MSGSNIARTYPCCSARLGIKFRNLGGSFTGVDVRRKIAVTSGIVELTETQVRHLEAIQHVITRLAGNSFALKALAGTIAAAVIAYAGSTDNLSPWVSGAGMLPSVVFWLMDAQNLRLERLFRKLYDGVRRGEVDEPFDMNFIRYNNQVESVLRIAISWSVVWFYLTLVVALIAIAVVGFTGSTQLEVASHGTPHILQF
jgi:hypothetical protein